ncbi:conserved hypothetical protein [Lodderomyces elongisporus NRRL YB-4239]|uniref:Uncharacterized protein n=1 Tax=Lodderomyces elongisporus (strain ATCC 11503 / CBS 2605 / JCM 1781 / NBRC 1676 / NRRL YB-4239) TaxID=379508 RepID=A5E768_LODEL|nr:conserved hypothetical protein [Lodderomyces elongisporus NRRL YB-4239]
MSQLFVDEDEEERYKPSTTTIKEEKEDEDMMRPEEQRQEGVAKTSLSATASESIPKQSLQAKHDNSRNHDDENNEFQQQQQQQQQQADQEADQGEEDDDPIIESIPLVMNQVPQKTLQSVHLLQFPGRPKTRSLVREDLVRASIKPESQYLDLKVPLDPTKFFDLKKVEDWGESIEFHSLSGVLDPTESGLYAGRIINDASTGTRKIVLIPVDSTVQLRTSFKYIDDLDKRDLQTKRAQHQQESGEQKSFQILQSAAKHSALNQDSHSHILGDAVKSEKQLEDEEWQHLTWKSIKEAELETLRQRLRDDADGIMLTTVTSKEEFIDQSIQ